LNTGDQIVAIDGYRASNAFLQSYLGERKPNDTVRLTVFRFDKLRDVTFKLGANTRVTSSIEPVEQPSDEQKRLYLDYMKSELGN
jgi:predicted metalloprotease with PDZ domain